MRHSRRGFTLVEVVLVILILGILAAVALPRLFQSGRAARVAMVEQVAGALRAAAEQAHLAWALQPNPTYESTTVQTADGSIVYMWRAYPDAGNCCAPLGIEAMVDVHGFSVVGLDNARTRFAPLSAPDPATCNATYREATTIGGTYEVTVTTAGC